MTKRKTALLTLGRLPKGLDIARALDLAGWRVIVAEPCRWHLTAVSRAVAESIAVPSPVDDRAGYDAAIRQIVNAHDVSLIVPISEESLYIAALAEYLPDSVRVLSMPFAVIESVHDKFRFAERCQALGLDVPKTVRLDQPGARDLLRDGAVVVKGRNSCAGTGLEFVEAGGEPPHRLYPANWIAQQHVDGALVSTYSIAHNGSVATTVVYRATIMSGTVAVSFERIDAAPALTRWVETFVAAENYSGQISFDFIVTDDGKPWAIECNPRATSGVHFLRSDRLADLLLNPDADRTAPYRDATQLMQFFPCLTELQRVMFKPGFIAVWRAFREARDVSFQWRDPLPLWTLPITAARIMRLALFSDKSFGEAATYDIEWQGPA
ncbi:MAG: ATP-grasp domain-containing protein [Pseudomonadota bacterium]